MSSNLGIYRAKHPTFSTAIGRITAHVSEQYHELKVVDVGANVGDTIATMRNTGEYPILGVEADVKFFSILKKNSEKFSNVRIVCSFVGEINEKIGGKLVTGCGTGYLSPSKKEEGDSMAVRRLTDILKEYPEFWSAKVIKIDTDGYDGKVIRGAREWLADVQPVLFFEYDPSLLRQQSDEGISIFSLLFSVGYRRALIYENTGEYMLSVELDNSRLLCELHEYFSGRKGRYCDICAFSEVDLDLCEKVRHSEIDFFRELREGKEPFFKS
jgi:FkbM family methyltransferase